MSDPATFARNQQIGRIGEVQVIDYYQHAKKISLIDVRGDKEYQAIDVDFIARPAPYITYWIETKTDCDHRPSVLAELMENTQTNRCGWLHRTRAHVIAYYQLPQDILILLDCALLKNYVIAQLLQGMATIITPAKYPDTRLARVTWAELYDANIIISAHRYYRSGWHDVTHGDMAYIAAWSDF